MIDLFADPDAAARKLLDIVRASIAESRRATIFPASERTKITK